MIATNIVDCIGNTPIVALEDELVPNGKKLYLKLEYFNPNFSVKDRTAIGLIKKAMDQGEIKPGSILIESTSGNLGKSLAMLGAVYKFRVLIVVDPKISPNLLKWYKAYGAEIDMVSELDEDGGYQKTRFRRVQELLRQYPEAFWPNQYDNPNNPLYHFETTGKEIIDLPIDAVVGAVSTGGHLCGIGRFVKENKPEMKVVACDVKGSAIFGHMFKPYLINGVGLSWKTENTDLSVIDHICMASDQEAISACRILSNEHGMMIGGSGGLSVVAALTYLKHTSANAVLAIIPDTGINYLDQIYDDEWLSTKDIRLLNKSELKNVISHKKLLSTYEISQR
ncbi:pyridoxal-phosphate dependent enzyme [Brevibacillus sp. HB1.2]|uniref:pyridoxal-phosphate dependent enzyme n=1 Tax=Brevibacillus TaxID=55080 RepID=UPI00156AD2AC|nr:MULTISPECIES: pyridoxal-phosphate dependent enzyme [unclassified Brevibacillus]NRS19086.1 pyridoxal-phosphate dependent enzyme [Brevibacillus sp. HB1.4B]NTU22254.1 pyridoxal-phosphate dependent enzyme [Brevibacillus sp. HB1.2]NTU28781.1 pyridoxal-phosphate dependent enzyme [Brevibacillus sp. HB1.1]